MPYFWTLAKHLTLFHILNLLIEPIYLQMYIINWVAAYLTSCKQFVEIDSFSDELPLTSGIPQGSVLGPLLFLIYINGFNIITPPIQIRLFADDCVLFNEIPHHEDQITLNSNLQNIASWCSEWTMELNANKTVSMNITQKMNKLSFTCGIFSEPLTEVNQYKHLAIRELG